MLIRIKTVLVQICITLVLFSILGEVILRIAGYQPFEAKKNSSIVIEPGRRLYRTDSTLGVAYLQGRFEVTLADGYKFIMTHDSNGHRITHPQDYFTTDTIPSGQIWIFGCSFTHGWSLNDEQTYPYLVQQMFPALEVTNFGTGGYGELESLMQLEQQLSKEDPPSLVVIAYGSFHDERSTLLRSWRKFLYPYVDIDEVQLPYARKNDSGSFIVHRDKKLYSELPLQRYSALINTMDDLFNRYQDHFVHSQEVSQLIIEKVYARCNENKIQFLLAGISNSTETKYLLSRCQSLGMQTIDISVDFNDPSNTNLPHDGHPGAKAHKHYAEALSEVIRPLLIPSN